MLSPFLARHAQSSSKLSPKEISDISGVVGECNWITVAFARWVPAVSNTTCIKKIGRRDGGRIVTTVAEVSLVR